MDIETAVLVNRLVTMALVGVVMYLWKREKIHRIQIRKLKNDVYEVLRILNGDK